MILHQTSAAILLLAGSVCFTAAGIRTQGTTGDSFGVMMFFAGLVLALAGSVGLIRACLENVKSRQGLARPPATGPLPSIEQAKQAPGPVSIPLSGLSSANGNFRFSPEVNAQLSLVSQMEGKDRSAIVEDILRQYLPRYSGQVAS